MMIIEDSGMSIDRYSRSLYIHGFLEVPKRDDLKLFDVLNLYELINLSDLELEDRLSNLCDCYEEVVAYSLGGRFLMRYYEKVFSKINKISILSAHPGNYTYQQRQDAKNFYELACHQLEVSDHYQFLSWWDQLPIFKDDDPLEKVDSTYDYKALFKRWPSYKQQNFSAIFKQDNIKNLISGEYDEKYTAIYQKLNLPRKLSIIPHVGHRTNTNQVIHRIIEGYYD